MKRRCRRSHKKGVVVWVSSGVVFVWFVVVFWDLRCCCVLGVFVVSVVCFVFLMVSWVCVFVFLGVCVCSFAKRVISSLIVFFA